MYYWSCVEIHPQGSQYGILVVHILHLHTMHHLPLLPNAQAYKSNMTYPRYMFLTYGWYEDRWFAEEEQGDDCTPAQRESVLQHTLAVRWDEFLTNCSIITDTGIVSQYFHESCDNVLGSPQSWQLC